MAAAVLFEEDDDGLRLMGLFPVDPTNEAAAAVPDEVESILLLLPGLPPPVPGALISGGLT